MSRPITRRSALGGLVGVWGIPAFAAPARPRILACWPLQMGPSAFGRSIIMAAADWASLPDGGRPAAHYSSDGGHVQFVVREEDYGRFSRGIPVVAVDQTGGSIRKGGAL